MGTGYYGPNSIDALCFCICEFIEDCGDDPAYAQTVQKLREVQRELDTLTQSPGERAAARASMNQTGHRQIDERPEPASDEY